jgi:hypothetical protein
MAGSQLEEHTDGSTRIDSTGKRPCTPPLDVVRVGSHRQDRLWPG